MEREGYERRVLEEIRDLLLEPDGRTKAHPVGYLGNRVEVDEVRLGDPRSEGPREVVLVYRDLWRPQRPLGWRASVGCASDGESAMEPAMEATVLWANFMEHVEASPAGLPRGRSPEGITWTV
jgi:hypothetical protein